MFSSVDMYDRMTFVTSFENTMAYVIEEDIFGETGSIGRVSISGNPNLSQLFTGTPQFYPGSLIQIEEILTIITAIVSPELVDVDYRWFSPKKYLGTFQIIGVNGLPPHADGDDGQVVSEYQQIKRYSWYTITANPSTIVGFGEQFFTQTCNLYLVPEVYTFEGTSTPVPGQRILNGHNPAMIGNSSYSKAPILDTVFNSKISGFGLHLNAGVEGRSVSYKAGVINTVFTDYPSFPVPVCELSDSPDCQSQFESFLVANDYHDSKASCEAVNTGNVCVSSQWFCPTNSLDVRTYWITNQGAGSGGGGVEG
jgi:hypothetical protein